MIKFKDPFECPKVGHIETKRKFAWLPVYCKGDYYWLGHYFVKYQFKLEFPFWFEIDRWV